MSDSISPCSYCKSNEVYVHIEQIALSNLWTYCVVCNSCYADGPHHNLETDAKAAWNLLYCNKVTDADRIEELEAKLAKAVDALEAGVICTTKHGGAAEFLRIARTTLAELKVKKDE